MQFSQFLNYYCYFLKVSSFLKENYRISTFLHFIAVVPLPFPFVLRLSFFTRVRVRISFLHVRLLNYVIPFRCEVSERGEVWKLHDIQAGACITFPPNAVTKPVLFRCTLWESTTHFPPLKKDEALVSSVIELTCDDQLSSNFTGEFDEEVTVALSHSASNLKGYEVVIRELVDADNNEWKDLKTRNIWEASGTLPFLQLF